MIPSGQRLRTGNGTSPHIYLRLKVESEISIYQRLLKRAVQLSRLPDTLCNIIVVKKTFSTGFFILKRHPCLILEHHDIHALIGDEADSLPELKLIFRQIRVFERINFRNDRIQPFLNLIRICFLQKQEIVIHLAAGRNFQMFLF